MLKVELPQAELSLFATVTVYAIVEPAVADCEDDIMLTAGCNLAQV